jgi:hypothetical protein
MTSNEELVARYFATFNPGADADIAALAASMLKAKSVEDALQQAISIREGAVIALKNRRDEILRSADSEALTDIYYRAKDSPGGESDVALCAAEMARRSFPLTVEKAKTRKARLAGKIAAWSALAGPHPAYPCEPDQVARWCINGGTDAGIRLALNDTTWVLGEITSDEQLVHLADWFSMHWKTRKFDSEAKAARTKAAKASQAKRAAGAKGGEKMILRRWLGFIESYLNSNGGNPTQKSINQFRQPKTEARKGRDFLGALHTATINRSARENLAETLKRVGIKISDAGVAQCLDLWEKKLGF